MKRLLLKSSLLLLAATVAFAQSPVMSPPDRRFYVTSNGDMLEWEPGFGLVVVTGRTTETRTVRRLSKRRVTSNGKTVVELGRSSRVDRTIEIDRRENAVPPVDLEAPRPKPSAKDEEKSLLEEVEPGRVIR